MLLRLSCGVHRGEGVKGDSESGLRIVAIAAIKPPWIGVGVIREGRLNQERSSLLWQLSSSLDQGQA